jgi:SAM-dependent methyltransferase
MYTRSANFYDSLYASKDYEKEAQLLLDLVQRWRPHAETLLDVACGTGKHLAVLRRRFRVEGLDANPALLEGARGRCPGVPLHVLDMRDFDLKCRFDVVTCLFSAIGCLPDVPSLNQALRRMAAHLTPEGLVIVEPWFTPETYWVDRLTVNLMDTADYRGTWMYWSRREGSTSILDIQYLVGGPNGIEHFSERHELTLFTSDQVKDAFSSAGLGVHHDLFGFNGRGLYIGANKNTDRPSAPEART